MYAQIYTDIHTWTKEKLQHVNILKIFCFFLCSHCTDAWRNFFCISSRPNYSGFQAKMAFCWLTGHCYYAILATVTAVICQGVVWRGHKCRKSAKQKKWKGVFYLAYCINPPQKRQIRTNTGDEPMIWQRGDSEREQKRFPQVETIREKAKGRQVVQNETRCKETENENHWKTNK